MSYIEQIFNILELEPTRNQREIKKAYAKLVKRYHPEEHPEEWKRIHNAYENAIQYSKVKEVPIEVVSEVAEPDDKERPQQQAAEPEDKGVIDFDSIIGQRQEKKGTTYQAELKTVIKQLRKLRRKSRDGDWEQVLDNTCFRNMLSNMELLRNWAAVLEKCRITLYIYQRIQEILSLTLYEIGEGTEAEELRTEVYRIQRAASGAYKRYQEKHPSKEAGIKRIKYKLSRFAGGVLGITLLAIILFLYFAISNEALKREQEASVEMATYLNEKYNTVQYDAEEIQKRMFKKSGSSDEYNQYELATEEGAAWVVCIGDNRICYDNYQKEEIEQALKQALLEEAGYSDCFIEYLNFKRNSDLVTGSSWWGNKKGYIQKFEGDLENFFLTEAERVKEAASEEITIPPEMINEGVVVYFPDAYAETITERIQNPVWEETVNYQQILSRAEEQYHLKIYSCVMSQDYYEAAKLISAEDFSRSSDVYGSSDDRIYSSIPFYFDGVTAVYAEGEAQAQTLVSLEQGVYVSQGDIAQQELVWKEERLRGEAKQFLKEQQEDSFQTFSFSLSGAEEGQEISLLLDIQELGIGEDELCLLIPERDGFRSESLSETERHKRRILWENFVRLDERYIILNYKQGFDDDVSNIYTLYWKK